MSVDSLQVEFNTTYQQLQVASGEGFQFDINDTGGNSGTLISPTFAYNTMIAAPPVPSMSYLVHGSSAYSSGTNIVTPISGTASLHDNYFDSTGAYRCALPKLFFGLVDFQQLQYDDRNPIARADDGDQWRVTDIDGECGYRGNYFDPK